MVYKEVEVTGLPHWLVFYRTKSGRLSSMTVDAETKEDAMEQCKEKSWGFTDFERTPNGDPIIKRKVYAHEMWGR